LFINFKVIDLD